MKSTRICELIENHYKFIEELSNMSYILEYNGNQVTVKNQRILDEVSTIDFDEMKEKYIKNPII